MWHFNQRLQRKCRVFDFRPEDGNQHYSIGEIWVLKSRWFNIVRTFWVIRINRVVTKGAKGKIFQLNSRSLCKVSVWYLDWKNQPCRSAEMLLRKTRRISFLNFFSKNWIWMEGSEEKNYHLIHPPQKEFLWCLMEQTELMSLLKKMIWDVMKNQCFQHFLE